MTKPYPAVHSFDSGVIHTCAEENYPDPRSVMRDESSYNAFITGPAADSQKAQKSSRDAAVQAYGG
jgi:hypothetical protein